MTNLSLCSGVTSYDQFECGISCVRRDCLGRALLSKSIRVITHSRNRSSWQTVAEDAMCFGHKRIDNILEIGRRKTVGGRIAESVCNAYNNALMSKLKSHMILYVGDAEYFVTEVSLKSALEIKVVSVAEASANPNIRYKGSIVLTGAAEQIFNYPDHCVIIKHDDKLISIEGLERVELHTWGTRFHHMFSNECCMTDNLKAYNELATTEIAPPLRWSDLRDLLPLLPTLDLPLTVDVAMTYPDKQEGLPSYLTHAISVEEMDGHFMICLPNKTSVEILQDIDNGIDSPLVFWDQIAELTEKMAPAQLEKPVVFGRLDHVDQFYPYYQFAIPGLPSKLSDGSVAECRLQIPSGKALKKQVL
ncbi:hypothetical protein [Neptuniibacter sp. QD37_11]|uniref:hypothetical protein n=1 Tax=Neptuniibacter sp. QD37_11 TaxID=3398209 RepID=UPI0039F4CF4B